MKPFRLGIVGTGKIAAVSHLPAALALEAVEVVALVDPVSDRAKSLADDYGISPCIARDVMGALDGVVVASPNYTHAEIGGACLRAGVHALVEKPLATSVADGETVLEAARAGRATIRRTH